MTETYFKIHLTRNLNSDLKGLAEMKAKISQLLELAISAPSGDNCQPWRFVVNDQTIKIFNVPERDTSLYNFQQKASLVAHGALIENILIASSAFGFQPDAEIFPDKNTSNLVATIALQSVDSSEDSLFPWILKRCTNRKKYLGTPLTDSQASVLLQAGSVFPGCKIYLACEPAKIKSLAGTVSNNDRLVFENRHLHEFLFDHIRWSDAEAMKTRDGLDLKTFELGGLDALGFKLMKNWGLVEKLNRVGLAKMVARQAEKLCQSAGGIGVVTVQGNSDEDFLRGGRAMQRIWLEAARLGLSFQPIAGIAFLMQRVFAGATEELAPQQVKLINDVRERISQIFSLGQEHVVMIFRIGSSSPPTVRSLRIPLEKSIRAA